jgi:hypothetical protein
MFEVKKKILINFVLERNVKLQVKRKSERKKSINIHQSVDPEKWKITCCKGRTMQNGAQHDGKCLNVFATTSLPHQPQQQHEKENEVIIDLL